MIWYLFNILILTFIQLAFTGDNGLKVSSLDPTYREKLGRKVLCVIGSLNWILLSGLRGLQVGDDTINYKVSFFEIKVKSWGTLFEDLSNKFIYGEEIKDPGYDIFVKICQLFTNDYQVYLIIVAVLFFGLMGITIYKYSDNPYQSFLLFSTLFYSFFAFTGVRQTIATAIVVFGGIKFIKEQKMIPFLFLFAIAIPIHFSAICFLPFYFISRIKINKGTLFGYWIAIALSFLFRNQFMSFLKELVGYEDYITNEGAAVTTFMFFLLFAAFLTTIFYKYVTNNDNPINRISINALFVACIFSSFLLINQNTMRVVQYYSLFLMFLLPEFKRIFKNEFSVTVYNLLCAVLLCFLLFKDELHYAFFWME